VEKLTNRFGKDRLEIHETASLSIIGTIIAKRSAAFVRTTFFIVVVGCASATVYNLIWMWR